MRNLFALATNGLGGARKPSRFRFTLRFCLALMTVAALLCAYPASIVRQSAIERAIVGKLPGGSSDALWCPAGPAWLRAIVGDERCQVVYFLSIYEVPDRLEDLRMLSSLKDLQVTCCDLRDGDVERIGILPTIESVDFSRTAVSDGTIELLLQFPKLHNWDLQSTQVSPGATKRLVDVVPPSPFTYGMPMFTSGERAEAGWPSSESRPAIEKYAPAEWSSDSPESSRRYCAFRGNSYMKPALDQIEQGGIVEALTFDSCTVSQADMHCIASLPNLRRLVLTGNNIGDAALAELRGHPALEDLTLHDDEVTAVGVRHLATLPRLRTLWLGGRGIRNAAICEVGKCRNLDELILANANVTSDIYPDLGKLESLRALSLYETNVGNRGIEDLARLKHLERLNVGHTFVDVGGILNLKSLKLVHLGIGGFPIRLSPSDRNTLEANFPGCELLLLVEM